MSKRSYDYYKNDVSEFIAKELSVLNIKAAINKLNKRVKLEVKSNHNNAINNLIELYKERLQLFKKWYFVKSILDKMLNEEKHVLVWYFYQNKPIDFICNKLNLSIRSTYRYLNRLTNRYLHLRNYILADKDLCVAS